MKHQRDRKKVYQKLLAVLYIFMIGLFAVLCLQSGDESGNLSGSFTEGLCYLFGIKATDSIHSLVRKLIGHFGYFLAFGLVSAALYLTFKKIKLQYRIGLGIIIGAVYILITEFVFQALATSRGPAIKDCLIDFAGFLISNIIFYAINFVLRVLNKKNLISNDKFMTKTNIIFGIIYIVFLIAFIVMSLMTGEQSIKVATKVEQTVVNVTPGVTTNVSQVTDNSKSFLRKVMGHFGYFVILGIISNLYFLSIEKDHRKWWHTANLLNGLFFAFMTEFVFEKMISSRGPSMKDVVTDSMGFILGNLFMYFIIHSIISYEKLEHPF